MTCGSRFPQAQLTASLSGEEKELSQHEELLDLLETKAGRLLLNQFPTGVEVCSSVVHGGPYPHDNGCSFDIGGNRSNSSFCSTSLLPRFSGMSSSPEELQDSNPMKIFQNRGFDQIQNLIWLVTAKICFAIRCPCIRQIFLTFSLIMHLVPPPQLCTPYAR